MELNKKVKIVVAILVNKYISTDEEFKQYENNIYSYSQYIDKLYIYQLTTQNIEKLYNGLRNVKSITMAQCNGYGEAEVFKQFLDRASQEKFDFAIMTKLDYYYEEDSFNNILNYITMNKTDNIAIISPNPLFTCQVFEKKGEDYREILGCRYEGCFINLNIYIKNQFIRTDFYQTTFDYEYCIRVRKNGYKILLSQNNVIRNQNYHTIEKRFLFFTLQYFDRDLMDIYYETRNRFYLWEEYRNIDKKYVKLDKKMFRLEKREIKIKDKNKKEKLAIIDKAKQDFRLKKLGKYHE